MLGRAEPWSGTKLNSDTKHEREGHHKDREERGKDSTPSTLDMGDLH